MDYKVSQILRGMGTGAIGGVPHSPLGVVNTHRAMAHQMPQNISVTLRPQGTPQGTRYVLNDRVALANIALKYGGILPNRVPMTVLGVGNQGRVNQGIPARGGLVAQNNGGNRNVSSSNVSELWKKMFPYPYTPRDTVASDPLGWSRALEILSGGGVVVEPPPPSLPPVGREGTVTPPDLSVIEQIHAPRPKHISRHFQDIADYTGSPANPLSVYALSYAYTEVGKLLMLGLPVPAWMDELISKAEQGIKNNVNVVSTEPTTGYPPVPKYTTAPFPYNQSNLGTGPYIYDISGVSS